MQATAAAAAEPATAEGQKVATNLVEGLALVVLQVAASPDGRLLATCGAPPVMRKERHVAVWYTATFKLARTLQGHRLGNKSSVSHGALTAEGSRS